MAVILIFELKNSKLHQIFADIQSAFYNLSWLAAPDEATLLNLAKEAGPDVVLIGDDEPESGLNLCRQLKRINHLNQIPVLFLVGKDAPSTFRKRALEAGADAFLGYPADEFEIRAQLTNLLKIKMANRILNPASTVQPPMDQKPEQGKTSTPAEFDSDLLFRNVMSNFPQRVFIKDFNSTYIACNESFASDLGIARETIAGKTDFNFYPKELADLYRKDDQEVITSGTTREFREPYFKDGEMRRAHTIKVPFRNHDRKIIGVVGILEDVTETHRMEKQLLESESRMRAILDNSLDAISLTMDGVNVFANQAYLDLFGYENLDEFLRSSLIEDIAPSAKAQILENIKKRAAGGLVPSFYETTGIRRNGEEFPFEIRVGTYSEGHATYSVGIIHDISERKKNLEKLDKVNRLYNLISQINKAIVRLKTKDALLQEVCRIAVDAGKFRMAWIGFIDEETKLVKPFAVSGTDDGYLSVIKPISASDIPEGRGPTGTALRQGRHSVCNDYANDPDVAIWREEALKRGYRSSVSLPIKEAGAVTGTFTIYASTPGFFDQEEIDLLNEVTSDIGFALDTILLEKEHQQALAALIESEEKYRRLTENMKDVIWVIDTDTLRFTYVSPSVEKLRGFTPEEIMAEPMDAALTPQQARELKNVLNQKKALFLEGKIPDELLFYTEEITQPCKDGSFIQTEVVTTLYLNPRTSKVELHGVTRDITQRRRAEEKLRESEQRYRLLFDNSFDALALTISDGNVLSANPAMCKMFGRTEKEIQEAGRDRIIDAADPRLPLALQVRAKTGHFFGELTGIRKDGTKFPIEVSSTLFTTQEGTVESSMIIRDLTDSKKEEEQRRILLRAVEQSPVSIVITDTSGQIQYVNPKFCELTGYSREEAIGKNPSILKSGDYSKEEYRKMWETILSGKEWHGEFRNLKKNGESYFENILISPVTDVSGKITQFVAIKEDITERKKTESLVRTLSAAVEQSPTMIVITDSDGKIEFTNQQFSEFLQYSAAEVFGKLPRIFQAGHQEPDLNEKMWQTLKSGNAWKMEHQNRKKDGTKFWEQVTVFPLTNEAGKVTNYIITQDDISGKKQLLDELLLAKDKAEESDHLKSAFLANMSHEIRTPLNSIIGFSELLLDPDFAQDQQADFVYMIKQSGSNLLSIINNIIDISKLESRQVTIRKQPFSLNGLIRNIEKENSRSVAEKNLDFRINMPEEEVRIFNDESKIKQVLVNFINNALKFTSEGFIEIGFETNQNLATIYVKDSGIGIPREFHGKIFERFRQVETALTRQYGGSGLGLAISKQLAELIGGKVSLESEPQKGSTFFLSLPLESQNFR